MLPALSCQCSPSLPGQCKLSYTTYLANPVGIADTVRTYISVRLSRCLRQLSPPPSSLAAHSIVSEGPGIHHEWQAWSSEPADQDVRTF